MIVELVVEIVVVVVVVVAVAVVVALAVTVAVVMAVTVAVAIAVLVTVMVAETAFFGASPSLLDIPLKVAQNLPSLLLGLIEVICPAMEMFLSGVKSPLLPLTFLRRGGSSASGESVGGNSFSSFLLFVLLDEFSLVLGGLLGGAGEMQGGSRQTVVLFSRRCFFSGIFSAASAGLCLRLPLGAGFSRAVAAV